MIETDATPMLHIDGEDAPPGDAAEDATPDYVTEGLTVIQGDADHAESKTKGVDAADNTVGDIQTEDEEEPQADPKEILGRILQEVPDIKILLFLGSVFGLLAGGCFGFWPYIFGEAFNLLGDVANIGDNAIYILRDFLILGVVFGITICLQFNFFIRFAGKVGVSLRKKYYGALLAMEMSFFDSNSTGELFASLSKESKAIEVGLGQQFGLAFQNVGIFLGAFIVAFVQSWLFTLCLLALLPVMMIGGGISGKILSEMSKQGTDIYAESNARSTEVMAGFDTIMSLNAGRGEVRLYEELVKRAKPFVKKKAFRVGGAMGLLQFINNGVFYGIGMYIAGILVGQHNEERKYGVAYGDIMSAFFGVFFAGMGMGQLATTLPDVMDALYSCQKLYKTIDRLPKVRGPDYGKEAIDIKIKGSITFENVSFSYPSRPDFLVLQDISLELKAGETVAFVGPSGCGKSTMISLLERFYDPSGGRILIDGVPVWNLKLTSWRQQLGYVGQEPVLFDGTIKENILLGLTEDYSSDVEQAARQANAHNFIEEFPEGYETKVGEGGGKLSGGQKQRISIARALVRQPQILLLDEATSALDTESEAIVQEALDAILAQGNRTCIVIAHRLSTITNADKIVVFQNGQIVQMGKYDDLAKDTNGVFHTMLLAQDVLGADALKPKQTFQSTASLPGI